MSEVQSVLLRRKKGFGLERARKKLAKMGFDEIKVDVTENWFRFRQTTPDKKKYSYRMKVVNPDVQFVIQFPKKRKNKKKLKKK